MKSLYKFLIAASFGTSFSVNAQQLPVISQYLYNPYLYNPARTGDNGMGSINLNFKRQWTAMPYAPVTGMLSMETPINNNDMGIGAMLYSDRTHIISRIGGMGTYAYHIPFSKDYVHRLSAGISLGFIHQSFDFEAATVENPNDAQILASNARGTSFDFSMGLNYRWKELNVGLSMLQGLNNQIRFLSAFGQEVKYINTRHFMSNVSYDFNFGTQKEWLVRPVVMTRIIPGLPVQAEVSVVGNWKKLLWASLGYRSSNWQTATSALTSSLGVELKNRIFIAYNFEITPSASLLSALGTQHEFMMAYRFGKDDKKEKELLTMREEIEKLKENDRILSERIDKTNTILDTLASNTKRIEEDNKKMNDKLNEVEKAANSGNQASEELKKKMQEQEDLIKAQQNAIDKNTKDIEELREAIKSQPMKYKKMGEIGFGIGSSELSAVEKSKLDALRPSLSANPNATIYLYGNASTDGDQNRNMELSSKRCIAVRKYLIEKGVPQDKLIVLPMGHENTKSGTTAVNPSDRRVDIMLSEK
jgi:type IX secretion system PorP/SprF family membrane protein